MFSITPTGEPVAQSVSGFGDPTVEFNLNLIGPKAQKSIPDALRYEPGFSLDVIADLAIPIGEYDGEVRWKPLAPTARDLFARTSSNAKVGTQQVYNEAKLRKTDLEDLLNGSLAASNTAEAKAAWGTVCDRSPLMQRLEMGLEPRLQQWTANKAEFTAKKAEILKEAELFVVMGHVLMQEGLDDADDAEYKGFCDMLKKAALEVVDAVKLGNDEGARQGVGKISKSCADCHDKYR